VEQPIEARDQPLLELSQIRGAKQVGREAKQRQTCGLARGLL
jgi:hypothetical protein